MQLYKGLIQKYTILDNNKLSIFVKMEGILDEDGIRVKHKIHILLIVFIQNLLFLISFLYTFYFMGDYHLISPWFTLIVIGLSNILSYIVICFYNIQQALIQDYIKVRKLYIRASLTTTLLPIIIFAIFRNSNGNLDYFLLYELPYFIMATIIYTLFIRFAIRIYTDKKANLDWQRTLQIHLVLIPVTLIGMLILYAIIYEIIN